MSENAKINSGMSMSYQRKANVHLRTCVLGSVVVQRLVFVLRVRVAVRRQWVLLLLMTVFPGVKAVRVTVTSVAPCRSKKRLLIEVNGVTLMLLERYTYNTVNLWRVHSTVLNSQKLLIMQQQPANSFTRP